MTTEEKASTMKQGYVGQCLKCGKWLKVDRDFCFDHLDLMDVWEYGTDEDMDAKAIANLKPEEGEDYWIQKEYRIDFMGSGHCIAWEGASGDVDVFSGEVEWDDRDEVHREETGRQRIMTFDNQPFNEFEWRQKKVSGLAVRRVGTNVRKTKQTFITDFDNNGKRIEGFK